MQSNVDQVINTVNALVENELNTSGVFGGPSISDFQASVSSVLQSNWVDLPTFDGEIGTLPSLNPDLFAMDISYFEGSEDLNSPDYFNGNISQITWATPNGGKQNNAFWYDGLDRLTKSEHRDLIANDGQDKYGVNITYSDLRGNIASITRNGVMGTCTYPNSITAYDFGQIDNLTYSYDNGTNKLTNLVEISDKDHGFKGDGGFIDYDRNGNMTDIGYKKMIATYNYLNLPTSFTNQVTGSEMIVDYDGAGQKLRKTVNDAEDVTNSYVKDYVGGIEYKDGQIEAIYFGEGRVIRKDNEYLYEYYLEDHLGNTRVVFSDQNKDGFLQPFNEDGGVVVGGPDGTPSYSEVLQESHYYPFGMNQGGPWDESISLPKNSYLYNGKELNSDFDLNWLDYGARWYDLVSRSLPE